MAGREVDLKALLRRVMELAMPNLRHYYRVPRKGRIVKAYASDGAYFADVQPLRNDESDDEREPLLPKIEIPILWGGPERGMVCPPTPGTLCDITYYDGDPDYPRISNFRWAKNKAPACELGAFIIQQKPGVYLTITPSGTIMHATDADLVNTIGGNKSQQVGGSKAETVGGAWTIDVTGNALIKAPQITLQAATKVQVTSPLLAVSGSIVAGANISDTGGAKSMAGMRQVYNAHTHQENGDGGGITNAPGQGM